MFSIVFACFTAKKSTARPLDSGQHRYFTEQTAGKKMLQKQNLHG